MAASQNDSLISYMGLSRLHHALRECPKEVQGRMMIHPYIIISITTRLGVRAPVAGGSLRLRRQIHYPYHRLRIIPPSTWSVAPVM